MSQVWGPIIIRVSVNVIFFFFFEFNKDYLPLTTLVVIKRAVQFVRGKNALRFTSATRSPLSLGVPMLVVVIHPGSRATRVYVFVILRAARVLRPVRARPAIVRGTGARCTDKDRVVPPVKGLFGIARPGSGLWSERVHREIRRRVGARQSSPNGPFDEHDEFVIDGNSCANECDNSVSLRYAFLLYQIET